MTTVVDALALQLSLDVAQLKKGAKEAEVGQKQLREDFDRHAKAFEASSSSLGRSFNFLAESFKGLIAALAVEKMLEFAKAAAEAGSNLLHTAHVLEESIPELDAWAKAISNLGGTDAAGEAFKNLGQKLTAEVRHFQFYGGEPPKWMALSNQYAQKGRGQFDLKFRPDGSLDYLATVEEIIKKVPDRNKRLAIFQEMGLSQKDALDVVTDPSRAAALLAEVALMRPLATTKEQAEAEAHIILQLKEIMAHVDLFVNRLLVAFDKSHLLGQLLFAVKNALGDFLFGGPKTAAGVDAEGYVLDSQGNRITNAITGKPMKAPPGWKPTQPPETPETPSTPAPATPSPTAPSTPGGHTDATPVPGSVLAGALSVLQQGGDSGALQKYMREAGYPKSGNWCGEFAAAVVQHAGGKPPPGAPVASNWLTWGEHVDPGSEQAGDIAVRLRSRFGGRVRRGQLGGHVGLVEATEGDSRFALLGGNQSPALRHGVPERDYEFRRLTRPSPNVSSAPGGNHTTIDNRKTSVGAIQMYAMGSGGVSAAPSDTSNLIDTHRDVIHADTNYE